MATMLSTMPAHAQQNIIAYLKAMQRGHNDNTEFRNKLEEIDRAYYRAIKAQEEAENNAKSCKTATKNSLEVPLVLSEVESLVAFLTEVYLSRYPLFPVIGTRDTLELGKALSAKIDQHAIQGRWGRQLLLFFKTLARYNVGAIECAWSPKNTTTIATKEASTSKEADVQASQTWINTVVALDMYNTFWDYRVNPADVQETGEFAGYNKLYNKPGLRTLIQNLAVNKEVINAREAMACGTSNISAVWNERPQVSRYIDSSVASGFSWLKWANNSEDSNIRKSPKYQENYMVSKFYARIIPAHLGIVCPKPRSPQIWQFYVVNDSVVLHGKQIVTPNDYLPILFGDSQEDGFGLQTESIAENVLAYQDAASDMLNIRIASANRALSDRGIYNPKLLSEANINNPSETAKIPIITKDHRESPDLGMAYKPIPFDHRATEGTIGDMNALFNMAERTTASNSARQGQFRPGNRTLGEFQTIMANASSRQRATIILLENQVFIPLKEMIKFNILINEQDSRVLTMATNPEELAFDIQKIREAMLNFKVADGYTPSERIMDPSVLQAALQTLPALPNANEEFDLISMFNMLMWASAQVDLTSFRRSKQEQEEALARRAKAQQESMQSATANGGPNANQS